MNSFFRPALTALLLSSAAILPATAADLPRARGVAVAPVEISEAFDPWMIRVRAIGVLPHNGGASNVTTPAGAIVGGLKVSNSVVPEVDISYFFTKNWAVEAICCLSPHAIKGTGGLAGITNIGKTTVFPPTVLLQYHFTGLGAFKPYIGAGVNYTHYFTQNGPALAGLQIRDSWGVAGQIGFDYMIDRNWGINFDVKKIMMEPKAVVNGGALVSTVKINPWVIGAGISYRFGGGAGAVVAKY